MSFGRRALFFRTPVCAACWGAAPQAQDLAGSGAPSPHPREPAACSRKRMPADVYFSHAPTSIGPDLGRDSPCIRSMAGALHHCGFVSRHCHLGRQRPHVVPGRQAHRVHALGLHLGRRREGWRGRADLELRRISRPSGMVTQRRLDRLHRWRRARRSAAQYLRPPLCRERVHRRGALAPHGISHGGHSGMVARWSPDRCRAQRARFRRAAPRDRRRDRRRPAHSASYAARHLGQLDGNLVAGSR